MKITWYFRNILQQKVAITFVWLKNSKSNCALFSVYYIELL